MNTQPPVSANLDSDFFFIPISPSNEESFFSDSDTPHFFINQEIDMGFTSLTKPKPIEKIKEFEYGQVQDDYDFFIPTPAEGSTLQTQTEVSSQCIQMMSSNQEETNPPQIEKKIDEFSSQYSNEPEISRTESESYPGTINKNKKPKNQYDKNIVANICSTVIRKMTSPSSEKQIRFYCKECNISYKEFMDYFRSFIRKNLRFGTSSLNSFFSKTKDRGIQVVFSLFMIRFLNEEYLSYMLRSGKMSDQKKYMECAINLMYIPKISPQQKDLMSQYHNLA